MSNQQMTKCLRKENVRTLHCTPKLKSCANICMTKSESLTWLKNTRYHQIQFHMEETCWQNFKKCWSLVKWKKEKQDIPLQSSQTCPLILVKRNAIERCATTSFYRNSVVKGKQVSLSAHIYVHPMSNVWNSWTNQFQPENHGMINIYFNIGSFLIAASLEI